MSVTIASPIAPAPTAALLKSEIQSGPFASTYAAAVTATDWVAIAALLNDETNATLNGPVEAPPISGAAFLAAEHPADRLNLSSLQLQNIQAYELADSVEVGDPAFQSFITGIFTQAQSQTTYDTLTGEGFAYKIGSRIEVLFGTGATVTNNDVQFAMTNSAPQPHIN